MYEKFSMENFDDEFIDRRPWRSPGRMQKCLRQKEILSIHRIAFLVELLCLKFIQILDSQNFESKCNIVAVNLKRLRRKSDGECDKEQRSKQCSLNNV